MNYYMIEAETKNPLPRIINWYKRIDPRIINIRDYHKIKEWVLLDVEAGKDTIYPDLISDPYFLLSLDAARVVSLYEPEMKLVGVRLFSRSQEVIVPYYLPIIPIVDCLSEESEYKNIDIDVKRAVIDPSKTYDLTLFQIAGIETQRVVVRQDLIESLLTRNAAAIRLKELEAVSPKRYLLQR